MAEKASTIFKEFREHSVAEFFKRNRQMLGYSGKIRSLTTIVHEYITNGLDACEEAGILPEIRIEIEQLGPEYYKVTATDNGPGIPKKHVGKVFGKMLAGTKFHRFIQQRGQQGIGAAGCTMYAQITTGKPVRVTTSTGNGMIYECSIMIDVKKNEPVITDEKEYPGTMRGTKVSGEFRGVKYVNNEYGPYEYIRRTAVANPHAKVVFKDPDEHEHVWERAVNVLPKIPKPSKPHPYGITAHDLIDYASRTKARNIRSFLVQTFDRMSTAKTKELEKLTGIDFNRRPNSISWEEAAAVVEAIKKVKFLAPSTKNLYPIGEKQIERAILNVLEPEFHEVITRPPSVYRGGVPFIVEAGIAYGGKAGRSISGSKKMELMRFANRAPLLFDAGACVITKVVNEIDWKRYGIKDVENIPLTVVVNLTSTYVPYTSAGKQAISDEEEVHKEIKLALQDIARRISISISRKAKAHEKQQRKLTLVKYIPEIAMAIEKLTGKPKQDIEKKLMVIVERKYAEWDKEEKMNGGDSNAEEENEKGEK